MSRSRGGRSLTRSPPMTRSPSVTSSSPAIIRSAVDFPQPDGPTRIMNSPSLMSRFMPFTASKPSGYRLVTSFRTISAIPLSLHCSGGEAGNDPALEDQYEDDDRDGHEHRGRGDG